MGPGPKDLPRERSKYTHGKWAVAPGIRDLNNDILGPVLNASGDPAFQHIVRQFAEAGVPLKGKEYAMALSNWETGRMRAFRRMAGL